MSERKPQPVQREGQRKPQPVRHASWSERQIREAQERGLFDDLPGAGKPIPNLDRPFTAVRWARDWVTREGGDLSALLPPLLILRKERAALLASLPVIPSETVLRETVADFNHRLLDQYRRPMDGPMIAVGVLDPEEAVSAWQQARPAPAPVVEPAPEPVRVRWWHRRRR